MSDVNTFYRAKRCVALANPTAETTFKQADSGAALVTYLPGSGKLTGQGIRIVCRGEIVTGASLNVTVALRLGTTVAGTLLATTGAVGSGGAGNFNFELVFEGIIDAVSDTIRGRMFGHVCNTAVAEVINSTAVTGFDADAATDQAITATALFGTSNAGNSIRVTELTSETD